MPKVGIVLLSLEEKKVIARQLREQWESYTEIGRRLGLSESTIRRWLVPGEQEQSKKRCKEYFRERSKIDPEWIESRKRAGRERYKNPKSRARILAYQASVVGRLASAKSAAKKLGYMPCTTDPKDISPRPEHCELCKKVSRVVLDHCHEKGKFRGWLCPQCNHALGMLGDTKEVVLAKIPLIVAYLKERG